jgi:uncharacterized protein (DUF2336 family)
MTPDELIGLAKQADRTSREALFGQITDLFLSDAARLSDRERALMRGILDQLVADVERGVRARLAERIKDDPAAPPELAELLAHDEADIASPILADSPALRDAALIAVVRDRSRAHAIAVAGRQGLSAEVADSVVSRAENAGDTELLETLATNTDAALSRAAAAYLVEEARRHDSFREPLVRRQDLPGDLAMRLYWLVAAALKRELLRRYALDEPALHDALEESVADARAHDGTVRSIGAQAERFLDGAGGAATGPRAIIGYVQADRLPLATAALARSLRVPAEQVRSCLLEGPAEALAVVCRTAGFSREQFVSLFCLCAPAWPDGRRVLSTAKLAEGTGFFDAVTERHARRILAYWRRAPGFKRAEADLAGSTER